MHRIALRCAARLAERTGYPHQMIQIAGKKL